MGHNVVAKAIEQEIKGRGSDGEVVIVDLIQYIYPERSKIFYSMFNIVAARYHGVYNFINKSFEKGELIHRIPTEVLRSVDQLIKTHEPDVIICTLPLWGGSYRIQEKVGSKSPWRPVTDVSAHKDGSAKGAICTVPTYSVKKMVDKE